MRRALVCLLAVALLAPAAYAAPVTYVLPTPGVVWGSTAAAARAAVLGVEGVVSAVPDVNSHTVTVELRDESVIIGAVVKALGTAGYTTGEPALKGAVKQ